MAVAAGEAAVADAGVRQRAKTMLKEKPMRPEKQNNTRQRTTRKRVLPLLVGTAILCSLGGLSRIAAQSKSNAAQAAQKSFTTPDLAAQALFAAAENFDVPALLEILGPDGKDLVSSEDPVADKNNAMKFAAEWREKHSIAVDSKNPARAEIAVGNDDWPLPIPLVNRGGKWVFDSKSGRQEVLFRRIGENELDTILVCRGFAEAQHEYAADKHDDSIVNQ